MSLHHRRRSVRLRGYDYRQPGLYFVTICTYGRQPLFGQIVDDALVASAFGTIAQEEWVRTPVIRTEGRRQPAGVMLDAFVVMPDHVHLLFGIVGDDASSNASAQSIVGATRRVAPTERKRQAGPPSGSIGAIIGQYKSAVTKRIRQQDPAVRVWQRGYHDRIVRTGHEADAIRRYIAENPSSWRNRSPARRDGHPV